LSAKDALDVRCVRVYLFKETSAGTRIEEVHVDDEFGIPEDEFLRVSEAIGDETFALITDRQDRQ